jgi:diaminohydroxyphosphoribosylaminopyrimidine deaminase/5-amino-6-(5-phosphoribosylamino)uracil reductase
MTRRALDLAQRGVGLVSPSPLVGCIIVSQAGDIVGEGFYEYEKLRHAETIALEQAGDRARGGTAYVSLEPHAHHGRTPPCTEALIRAGVRRVVSPIEDPNPMVAGKGFTDLRSAGVEVVNGVLADEAELVNEHYMVFIRNHRPFVHLKLATSLDGRIATRTGDSQWITGPTARQRVQELRHECDAILIGANTAAKDDPLLTDRSGLSRRKPLTRIVLDGRLSLSPESRLVKSANEAPLIVIGNAGANQAAAEMLKGHGVEVIDDPSGSRDIGNVLRELGNRSIQSVLVEGGARVAGAFLDAKLVDRITFFVAPIVIGGEAAPAAVGGLGPGLLRDAVRLSGVSVTQHGEDLEITGKQRPEVRG